MTLTSFILKIIVEKSVNDIEMKNYLVGNMQSITEMQTK